MKRIISLLVCISLLSSMCVPAFATQQEDSQLPPGVVLSEGEVWIPAKDEIMPLTYDDICPEGFHYAGKIKGNYVVDLLVGSAIDSTVIASIPKLVLITTGASITIPACVGIIYGLASGFISYYSTPKSQQSDYEKLIFVCDDTYAFCGFAYPYINYYYIMYYATLVDGHGNTKTVCAATKDTYEYALLP